MLLSPPATSSVASTYTFTGDSGTAKSHNNDHGVDARTKGLQTSVNFEHGSFSIGIVVAALERLRSEDIWLAYLYVDWYAGSLHERLIGQLLAEVWLQPIRCESCINMSAHEDVVHRMKGNIDVCLDATPCNSCESSALEQCMMRGTAQGCLNNSLLLNQVHTSVMLSPLQLYPFQSKHTEPRQQTHLAASPRP